MTQFKPGDRVIHNPTGEEWILVKVYGSYVVPSGWAAIIARLASDCKLIARDQDQDQPCTCTTTEQREACTKECDTVVL